MQEHTQHVEPQERTDIFDNVEAEEQVPMNDNQAIDTYSKEHETLNIEKNNTLQI